MELDRRRPRRTELPQERVARPTRGVGRPTPRECATRRSRLSLASRALIVGAALLVHAAAPRVALAGEETESLDTPRASIARFLDACRSGQYEEAARFLRADTDGPRLARHLKAVLDRNEWIDLDRLSADPHGDVNDGLAAETDEVMTIKRPDAGRDPVRVVRVEDADGTRWKFSRGTVERIETWYRALPDHFALEHLPEVLLRPGWFELLWWQWAALPVLVVLALLGGRALGWVTREVLGRVTSRTAASWDDLLVRRVGGPLTAGWALALLYLAVPRLALLGPAEVSVRRVLGALALFTGAWAMLRTVEIGAKVVTSSAWVIARPASRALIPIASRAAHIAVLAIAAIVILSYLGVPVTSLVAGLGVGGLALALAAQKTVENLFGAFSLGLDQPIREGDFIKVEDFVGTVEAIGLRSTRIRTLDRTVVSLPNGKLADMRLESYTARDRLRLSCTVGLVYGTTEAQLRTILDGLERVLRAHPLIWPDTVVVRFSGFGESSLDVEVMAWFQTTVWGEFQAARQEVLLGFMAVVEEAGSGFAFPTRTVHVVGPEAARLGGSP